MAPGDPERPDRPDYNVYRAGSGGRGRGRRADKPSDGVPPSPESPGAQVGAEKAPGVQGKEEGTGYTVYKGGRSGSGVLGSLKERFGRGGGDGGGFSGRAATSDGGFSWRRAGKWFALALGAWLLVSLILFCISAQIQKSKLDDGAADELGGLSLMIASGQTILVIGSDVRPEGVPDTNGNPTEAKCVEAAGNGSVAPEGCAAARADTLMLVRAGGGAFQKLSIPRDVVADVPGDGPDKINAAFALGGAKLQIQTVEDFLGIDIDHVVILDFAGFADFIDSLGGVQVDLPQRVHAQVDGGGANGGVTLKLEAGENELNGFQALALARARELSNDAAAGDPARAQRQQLILEGIQSRLTSPTRIPYNLIHAPWIAWNAPKAMVTDMGALTLPQLVLSSAIGGSSDTKILKTSGTLTLPDGGAALTSAKRQCEKAVEDLLGEQGPREPECSPGG